MIIEQASSRRAGVSGRIPRAGSPPLPGMRIRAGRAIILNCREVA